MLAATMLPALAQERIGTFSIIPRVGVTVANLSNNKIYFGDNGAISSKSKSGFIVGADAYYQATDQVGVSLGVFYTSLGCKFDDHDVLISAPASQGGEAKYDAYTDFSTTLNYVAVPLLAHVYVANGLALKAGVQASFLTGAKTEYTTRSFMLNTETGARTYDSSTSQFEDTNTDNYQKVDVSFPVGASYEYMNVVLDARYNLGLTKVDKINNSKNRAFVFTVGYKFTL